MEITLGLKDLLTIVLSVLGAFSAVFWGLQRYTSGRMDRIARQVSATVDKAVETSDHHAAKFEDKLDDVVHAIGEIKTAVSGVAREHGARIDEVHRWVGRLERRLEEIERHGRS